MSFISLESRTPCSNQGELVDLIDHPESENLEPDLNLYTDQMPLEDINVQGQRDCDSTLTRDISRPIARYPFQEIQPMAASPQPTTIILKGLTNCTITNNSNCTINNFAGKAPKKH
jgi:hypothetical protein